MPILVDASQVMFANLFADNTIKPDEISEDLFRHFMLNSIRTLKNRFSHEFGEIVLCFDGSSNWRKNYWPLYKASRAKSREDSKWDFKEIHRIFNNIYEEFRENLPYSCLKLDAAEGDDIIMTVTMWLQSQPVLHKEQDITCPLVDPAHKILIISSDKDFRVLQMYPGVQQYSSIQKKFVDEPQPERYLQRLIIKGDTADGIPNVLSIERSFVDKIRQKPIREDKIQTWSVAGVCNPFPDHTPEHSRYTLNEILISPFKIPKDLSAKIIDMYTCQTPKKKSHLLNYFTTHRLSLLTEHLTEF